MDSIIQGGFVALETYVKENLPGEFPSSCWTSADYFFHKCKMNKSPDDQSAYPNIIIDDDLDLNESNKLRDGTYHFVQDSDYEFHHFVIIVSGSTIKLVQTYGGIDVLTVKCFDKNEWMNCYAKALKGNKDCYRKVFDIPNSVNLDKMEGVPIGYLAYEMS